jgi:hypothetical protein
VLRARTDAEFNAHTREESFATRGLEVAIRRECQAITSLDQRTIGGEATSEPAIVVRVATADGRCAAVLMDALEHDVYVARW